MSIINFLWARNKKKAPPKFPKPSYAASPAQKAQRPTHSHVAPNIEPGQTFILDLFTAPVAPPDQVVASAPVTIKNFLFSASGSGKFELIVGDTVVATMFTEKTNPGVYPFALLLKPGQAVRVAVTNRDVLAQDMYAGYVLP